MLELTQVARLEVSAASGVVVLRDRLYVVADDETFLAVYSPAGQALSQIELGTAALPVEHAQRKAHKPDYEALCVLPDGRLLVLGSGSTPQRMRGALVSLPVAPGAPAQVTSIDLRPLYERLASQAAAQVGVQLTELNIEGAVVFGERLWLLQRGNGPSRVNACVELELAGVLAGIDARGVLDASTLRSCQRVELGELRGVALSFTDAAAHPTLGLLFSAAAEATDNTYDDGQCVGSVVGRLAPRGQALAVRDVSAVTGTAKIEGLCVAGSAREGELYLVCDADDRNEPATLFSARLPWREG